jgi:hypothetical protein
MILNNDPLVKNYLLNTWIDVETRTKPTMNYLSDGLLPIHLAACKDNLYVFVFLYNHHRQGCNIETTNGCRPLCVAPIRGNVEVFISSDPLHLATRCKSCQTIFDFDTHQKKYTISKPKENDPKTKENDLKTKANDLKPKETDLKTKENDLKTKENDLKTKENDLKTKETDLKPKENDLKTKENDRKTKENDPMPKENDLKTKETDLKTKENDLKTKENDLKTKENDLKTKENDLKPKENDFKPKDNDLETKENDLKTKENDPQAKEKTAFEDGNKVDMSKKGDDDVGRDILCVVNSMQVFDSYLFTIESKSSNSLKDILLYIRSQMKADSMVDIESVAFIYRYGDKIIVDTELHYQSALKRFDTQSLSCPITLTVTVTPILYGSLLNDAIAIQDMVKINQLLILPWTGKVIYFIYFFHLF